jgi:hypothetical protein
MVFVVALAIGVAVSMTRSVVSIALSAALIGFTFLAAALLSQGGVSFLSLLLAIAGFNCAFAGQLAILLALPSRRAV